MSDIWSPNYWKSITLRSDYLTFFQKHYEPSSSEVLDRTIPNANKLLNYLSIASESDFVKGYKNHLYLHYCTEISLSEGEGMFTIEETEKAINKSINDNLSVDEITSRNIMNALTQLYLNVRLFYPSLAKEVHHLIASNLDIKTPGIYRNKDVKPCGEDFYYIGNWFIETKLEVLFKICREAIILSLEDAIKITAYFLERFLYIHPFFDGNGRTGRLLASYLLRNYCNVPVSFYLSKNSRGVFLSCIKGHEGPHDALAKFILFCVDRTVNDALYMLEVEN